MPIYNNIPVSRDVYHVSDVARQKREAERPDRVSLKSRTPKKRTLSETVEIARRCEVCGATCIEEEAGEEGTLPSLSCPAALSFEAEHQQLDTLLTRLRDGAPAGIKAFLMQEARQLARTLRERVDTK